jgi:hypothetical protein
MRNGKYTVIKVLDTERKGSSINIHENWRSGLITCWRPSLEHPITDPDLGYCPALQTFTAREHSSKMPRSYGCI